MPSNFGENIFQANVMKNFQALWGKYHVKFGHFINFLISLHTFSGKNILPPES